MENSLPVHLIDTYIKPHIWNGFLWCEGGWGPKNEIQDLYDSFDVTSYLIVEPISRFVDSNGNDPLEDKGTLDLEGLKFLNREAISLNEVDKKYVVSFLGTKKDYLERFVKEVAKFTNDAKLILSNVINPSQGLPLQLTITIKDGVVTYIIDQGAWKASFDSTNPVAGW
jgi:hypothetical protein